MTQQELLAQLRTYLGGTLGNAAADEIERLTALSRGEPSIEHMARILGERGLTIVSGKDAEKIKKCTGVCDG